MSPVGSPDAGARLSLVTCAGVSAVVNLLCAAFFDGTAELVACAVMVAALLAAAGAVVARGEGSVASWDGCALTAVLAVNIAVLDLLSAGGYLFRFWPFYIPLFHAVAAPGVPRVIAVAVAAFAVCVSVLISAEFTARFGAFDMPNTITSAARRRVLVCEAPPCRGETSLHAYGGVIVFLATLAMNHAAAAMTRQPPPQLDALEDAIAALGRMDVEGIELLLTDAEAHGITDGVAAALGRAAATLAGYRFYVPQAMLVGEDGLESPSGAPDLPAPAAQAKPAEGGAMQVPEGDDMSADSSDGDSSTSSTGSSQTDPFTAPPTQREATPQQTPPQPGFHPPLGPTPSPPPSPSNDLRIEQVTALSMAVTIPLGLTFRTQPVEYGRAHEAFLAAVLKSAATNRGLIEAVLGSRVIVSFNTSRKSYVHANMAVKTVKSCFLDLEAPGGRATKTLTRAGAPAFTAAVATGTATVGVLGHAPYRRPVLLGRLVERVSSIEKAAQLLGYRFVCNNRAAEKALREHRLRIILDRVYLEDRQLLAEHFGSRPPGSEASTPRQRTTPRAAARAAGQPSPAYLSRAYNNSFGFTEAHAQLGSSAGVGQGTSVDVASLLLGDVTEKCSEPSVLSPTEASSTQAVALPMFSRGNGNNRRFKRGVDVMGVPSESSLSELLSSLQGPQTADPSEMQSSSEDGVARVNPMAPSLHINTNAPNDLDSERPAGDRRAPGKSILFEIIMPVPKPRSSPQAAHEWMYELDEEAADQWAVYNGAGKEYLSRGFDNAMRYADAAHMPQDMKRRFAAAGLLSRTIDLNGGLSARLRK